MFDQAASALAASFSQEEVNRVLETEGRRVTSELTDAIAEQAGRVDVIKTDAEETLKEVKQTLEAAKAAAEDAGVASQSKYFEQQASEHKNAANRWLFTSGLAIAALIGTAVWSVYYYLTNPPTANGPTNFQLLAAKVVLFSALFTGLIATTRSYRAHRHNYVVNRHRQNALLTFRAFSQQANADLATKNAVLLQATQCIFSPQVTGYSSHDVDSNFSPILEIVRGVTEKH